MSPYDNALATKAGVFPRTHALGFAQSTWVGQRRIDRVNKRPELRRLCFDIDPHGELAERGAAHRADGRDERSVEALLKRRQLVILWISV
jgi:hypothetical protein